MKRAGGQSMIFVVMFLMAIALLMLSVYGVGDIVRSRIRLQTAADAAARSAAVWKARALNEIAALNSAGIACLGLRAMLANAPGLVPEARNQWGLVLMAEQEKFKILATEVADRHRFQAEADAYTVAYATLSGGHRPGRVPTEYNPSVPRESYGGLVISGDGAYPPDFNLQLEPAPAHLLPPGNPNRADIFRLKQPDAPLRSIAWYRGMRPALSPLIDRFLRYPTFCFAQADAICPHEDGRNWVIVPSWKASLQRSSISPDQIRIMLTQAGIGYTVSDPSFNPRIMQH